MTKFINIQNLIYLTIFSSPTYLIKFSIFKIPTNLLEVLILITIAYWFWKNILLLYPKIYNLFEKNKILTFSIFTIILGLIISSFLNNNLLKELSIIKSWFILPILFGLVTYDQIKSTQEIQKILNTIFYSSAFISIVSLFYLSLSKLTYDGRLSSIYLSPNHLAMILAPGLLIGTWSILNKNKFLLLKSILILDIILVLFFTHSYATWVALAISLLCITPFLISPKKKAFFFIIITSIFLIFLFFENESDKFKSILNLEERSSLNSRLIIWQSSRKILSENWLWGIGPGNFQEKYLEYQKYFPPYLEWAVPQPHNLFLAFWLQSGLLGFLGFILLLFYFCLKTIKTLFYLKDFYQKSLYLLFISLILEVLLVGLLDTPYWKNDLALIFWSIIFLNATLLNKELN